MYLKCTRRIRLKDLNEMSLILDIRIIGASFKILKKFAKRVQREAENFLAFNEHILTEGIPNLVN